MVNLTLVQASENRVFWSENKLANMFAARWTWSSAHHRLTGVAAFSSAAFFLKASASS